MMEKGRKQEKRKETKFFFFLVTIALLTIFGCQTKSVRNEDVVLLADLECQARQLKEQRFQTANKLRLRGDSLMKANITLSEVQRMEEDSLKQTLTVQTGELAARLTFVMDSLFEAHYKTREQREAFDVALENKVEEICK